MTTSELVTNRNFALLSNKNFYQLVHAWWQFIATLTGEHFDVDDLAAFTVRNLERGVANFASLLTKDCTEQTLFRCEFGFTLRCDFADQYISRTNFCTDTDDAFIVEVANNFVGQVWNVT